MKGRKPIPTKLKLLRGNPGQYPINGDEPQPPPLTDDTVPHELKDAHARAEWKRIAPGLIACGQVTMADRTLLVVYCQKFGQWLRLEELVLQHPLVTTDEDGKRSYADAQLALRYMRAANRTLELVMRAAAELGITPSSRSRVLKTPQTPAASKWAGALP